ncbi:MAG: DUF4892 domain-containing protein [Marinobacterium sp.]|nr:DUF4892 domain-containing protein [Marinobacterium sp.]
MGVFRYLLLMAIVLLVFVRPLPLFAATDLRGSEDHALLERYPRSWIVNYRVGPAPDYRWVLGALEKVNNVLSAESEQRLTGQLTRISYRIPAGVLPQEAYDYIRKQLLQRGAEERFRCEGRACGSSNEWANRVFRYARLYGVERSQRYSAWQLNNVSVALYAVQRGNKRVYLHLDLLQQLGMSEADPYSPAPDAVAQVARLQTQGYIRWPVVEPEEALLGYLKRTTAQFWLVGHDRRSLPPEQLKAQSQQQAEQVRQKLIAQGIAATRLQSFGIGALAPGLIDAGEQAVFLIQRP